MNDVDVIRALLVLVALLVGALVGTVAGFLALLGGAPPVAAVRQACAGFAGTVALAVVVGTALGCF
ncbi:hypothetical protein [Streptomyces sp. NPDC016845]|uniref:hypothetical protein n=1 Tax=Streptomyces sp. NPDC016845 TaxID=3364972 RepID=UPI00379C0490